MKERLTKEESAHLISLGVPEEKASKCIVYFDEEGEQIGSDEIEWAKEDGHEIDEELIDKNYSNYDHSYENDVPIFTLTDLLEILPKEIEIDEGCKDTLVIDFINGSVYAQYTFQSRTRQESEELIDSLYELCVWCLKNKYLKFKEYETDKI